MLSVLFCLIKKALFNLLCILDDKNTSKFNHQDPTTEVIVDIQHPVNRDGHIIKSQHHRAERQSKILNTSGQTAVTVGMN